VAQTGDVVYHRKLSMRIIVNLPDRLFEALGRFAESRKLPRTEIVRQAVDLYLAKNSPDRDAAFGLWKRAGEREDGLDCERRMRREWGY
jgi:predicted transcriptional regulator